MAYIAGVLILVIIATGMAIGAVAQYVMGRAGTRIDWTMALVAGIGGSFVGGLLISLLNSDGISLRPSGLIGSFLGAVIITALWIRFDAQKRSEARIDRRR